MSEKGMWIKVGNKFGDYQQRITELEAANERLRECILACGVDPIVCNAEESTLWADARLGAQVRLMPVGFNLRHDSPAFWIVRAGGAWALATATTPEDALGTALAGVE